jgi:hypothetical protein
VSVGKDDALGNYVKLAVGNYARNRRHLHRERDFECIAAVTGQALQWRGPEAGK